MAKTQKHSKLVESSKRRGDGEVGGADLNQFRRRRGFAGEIFRDSPGGENDGQEWSGVCIRGWG